MVVIHSFVDCHLGWLNFLAIVNRAAINMDLRISLRWKMEFSGYLPRYGIAGLYDSSVFNFLGELETNIHNDCINLCSRQIKYFI